MLEFETVINLNNRRILRDTRRTVFTRRYFYRSGHKPPQYNWIALYKAIHDFKMIFKFTYDLNTHLLKPHYVIPKLRWFNKMRFLQFYLFLLRRVRWYELPMKKLFFYLNKAKRLCYLKLIKQAKK